METIAAYFGTYTCALVIARRASIRLKKFLQKHDMITDEQVLKEFKLLVRREMYENLIIIALLGCGLGTSLALAERFHDWGRVIIYTPLVLFALHSMRHSKLERRVKRLPAATEELAHVHRQVINAWKGRFFPNF
jgi:hypothetical protein